MRTPHGSRHRHLKLLAPLVLGALVGQSCGDLVPEPVSSQFGIDQASAELVAARSVTELRITGPAKANNNGRRVGQQPTTTTTTPPPPSTTTPPPPSTTEPPPPSTTTPPPTTTTPPPTTTTPPPPTTAPAPAAKLIWSDEFSAPLDLTTPNHQGRWRANDVWQNVSRGYRDFAGTSWNLNPNETPSHNPFSVQNGALTIKMKRTPAELHSTIAASMAAQGQTGPVPEWSGGILITNPAVQQFRYGYFEVRARFRNVGPGMFPAVWLFATGGSTNPLNKGNAEIDIMEIFGHARGDRWDSTVHYRDNAGKPVRKEIHLPQRSGDPSVWRTYAVDWQPNHLRFYDNGVLIGELTGADASWFDTSMSLRLNYSMDAPWFPSSNKSGSTTPNEMFMDVDYVRVYDVKP